MYGDREREEERIIKNRGWERSKNGRESFTEGPNNKGEMKDNDIQLLDSYTLYYRLHTQGLGVKFYK